MNGDIIEEDAADEEDDQDDLAVGKETSLKNDSTQSEIARQVLLDLVDLVVDSITLSRIENGLIDETNADDRHKSSVSSGSAKARNATEVSVSKRLTAY